MLKKTKKTKRNPQKTLAVLLALANSFYPAAPLALPLTAIVSEMPKTQQGSIDELIATTFNRGGQLFDYLFFTTAYAGDTIGAGQVKNVNTGIADGDTITSGGVQNVNNGGTATGTTINSGGEQIVYSGAIVTDSTANTGGIIALLPSAALAGTTTLNQGTIETRALNNSGFTINRLVTDGGTVRLASPNGVSYLNINNLDGAANFIINTDLANGNSDRINITRSTSAVSTIQVAYDPGFETGKTISAAVSDPKSYQAVIFAEVRDQAQIGDDDGETSFTALPTDYGAYRFTPVLDSAVIGDLGTRWIIKELSSSSGGTVGMSETMYTASDVITNNVALWRNETHDLTRRMGELRNNEGQAGMWARIYRGELETANPGSRDTQTQYTAIQGGYDKKHADKENGTWYTGYTVGYLDADTELTRGGGETSSLSVGAYGSWLGNKGHFLDLIVKQGRLHNRYHNYLNDPGNTRVTGNYHNWGTILSAEYGYRKQLTGQWYLEPQAQLSFSRIGSASYTASDGTAVYNQSINSFVGRLGVAIGQNTPTGTFYAKASIAKEFNACSAVTMSTGALAPVTLEQDLKESWLEFALGLTGSIGKNTNGYLEVSKTTGDTVKTSWLVNAGLRKNF